MILLRLLTPVTGTAWNRAVCYRSASRSAETLCRGIRAESKTQRGRRVNSLAWGRGRCTSKATSVLGVHRRAARRLMNTYLKGVR